MIAKASLCASPFRTAENMKNLDDDSAELPVDDMDNPRLLYELRLLRYWARSRPVARIHLATMLDRRLCRGIRATWTLWHMQVLNRYDMFGCRGCGAYPTEATCAQCDTKWCWNCADWSGGSCWKCYRSRQGLNDCGELSVATISASTLPYLHR